MNKVLGRDVGGDVVYDEMRDAGEKAISRPSRKSRPVSVAILRCTQHSKFVINR